jgi:hypothetical protein
MSNPGAEPERLLAKASALRFAFAALFDVPRERGLLPPSARLALENRAGVMVKPLLETGDSNVQVHAERILEELGSLFELLDMASTDPGRLAPGPRPSDE